MAEFYILTVENFVEIARKVATRTENLIEMFDEAVRRDCSVVVRISDSPRTCKKEDAKSSIAHYMLVPHWLMDSSNAVNYLLSEEAWT